MKKTAVKWTAVALAGAMRVSLVGCMPTQTQLSAEQNSGSADAGATTAESTAVTADMEVDTTTPITLRMNWWGGETRHKATLEAIQKFQ